MREGDSPVHPHQRVGDGKPDRVADLCTEVGVVETPEFRFQPPLDGLAGRSPAVDVGGESGGGGVDDRRG